MKKDKVKYTDEEVDAKLLEALMLAGFHETIKNENVEVDEETKQSISFSKAFDERVRRMFTEMDDLDQHLRKKAKRQKVYNTIIKIAACFAVFIFISIVTVVSSEAARIKFLNIYVETFDISTDFTFYDEDADQEYPKLNEFNYIPFGYELIGETENEDMSYVRYENQVGQYISITTMAEGAISLDTESAEATEQMIGDHQCFVSRKDDMILVLLSYQNRNYQITSNGEWEEIKKMIENIQ